MKNNRYYFIEEISGEKGCPFLGEAYSLTDGKFTGEYEWDSTDPDPFKFTIKSKYSLKISYSSFMDLDYSNDCVSELFLSLLDELNVEYRCVPLEIILRAGKKPEKKYYYLLPVGRFFILDRERSEFIESRDLYTQELMYDPFYPDIVMYSAIRKFFFNQNVSPPDFFICGETRQYTCTEKFKNLAIEKGLKGIDFIEMKEGFTYDPRGDIEERWKGSL